MSSATDDRLECTTWDAEYIQQWLRLDETRSAMQQQQLELEYDRAELEDWSLSLSTDDLREQCKKIEALTPGQISISTLPSIQENNTLELEEDSNECLWNNSSYMMDKEGRELITLLMDSGTSADNEKSWPYASTQQISPDNSWSSGSDCCQQETCSKRSSVTLSDDTNELPVIGTDFTRDFYRLVKFESTKSLASTSSRSIGDNNGDRETTLQNVLTFIAEQQKYAVSTRPNSAEITKDFNIEGPPQKLSDNENYVTLKQLCEEYTMNEQNTLKDNEDIKHNLAYADEVCLVTALDVESENCSNITEHPVDICSSINVELSSTDYQTDIASDANETFVNMDDSITQSTSSDISTSNNYTSSSTSTPDTIVSKIPRRRHNSKIPVSPAKKIETSTSAETKIPKSKIPHKSSNLVKQKIIEVKQNNPVQHIITSEKLPQCSSGVISNIIDGPPHRAVSFHERATSKDVIDELNRMIKNGDEANNQEQEANGGKLDQGGRTTGWIHVEKDIDLTDPKVCFFFYLVVRRCLKRIKAV